MKSTQIKDSISDYYDQVAEIYDDLYEDKLSQAENEIVKQLLIKFLPNKNSKILDLGSGKGLARELVEWRDYTGLDISKEMTEGAKKKHPNDKFLVGDMEKLEFNDESFDYVISLFGSMSHSLSPYQTATEIYRVLKPGGRILIMVYSQFSLKNFRAIFDGTYGLENISPIQEYKIRNLPVKGSFARFYTKRKLKSLFRNFKDVKIMGLNGLYEVDFFKKNIQNHPKALTKLQRDFKLVSSINPNWGHSLIIVATKPEK